MIRLMLVSILLMISCIIFTIDSVKCEIDQQNPEDYLQSEYISDYRDYDETLAELTQISYDYPDITQLISLGNSTCYNYYLAGNNNYIDFQHQIWCLKISDNPEMEEDEPNVFFASEIHARELISLEVNMHVLNYLVSNYGIIDSVTTWIDNNQIWFIPIINPDGHKVVMEELHTMHRKSMRDNNSNFLPDYSTIDGVDINRNFGYVWGPNGTSSEPSSLLYNGPYAWSETETCLIRDLLTSRKFYGGITYHSYGEWVLYPLGHIPGACSYDYEIMGDLAQNMAETIPKFSGTGSYQPAQAVNYYSTCQGTMGDWGYAVERMFSFTVELATAYAPPSIYIDQICEDNLEAALIFIDRISYSTVTGHIYDDLGNSIVAEIHVPVIDEQPGMTSVEPVRSENMFGRYYRLLLPGTYNIIFRYEGFEDIVVEDVIVTSVDITEIDVQFSHIPDDKVLIEANDEFIKLSWKPVPLTTYEIYSSLTPAGQFSLNLEGEFLSLGSWQETNNSEKKFYKIIRYSE